MNLPATEPAGALKAIDPNVKLTKITLKADGTQYCLEMKVDTKTAAVQRGSTDTAAYGGGDVQKGATCAALGVLTP